MKDNLNKKPNKDREQYENFGMSPGRIEAFVGGVERGFQQWHQSLSPDVRSILGLVGMLCAFSSLYLFLPKLQNLDFGLGSGPLLKNFSWGIGSGLLLLVSVRMFADWEELSDSSNAPTPKAPAEAPDAAETTAVSSEPETHAEASEESSEKTESEADATKETTEAEADATKETTEAEQTSNEEAETSEKSDDSVEKTAAKGSVDKKADPPAKDNKKSRSKSKKTKKS